MLVVLLVVLAGIAAQALARHAAGGAEKRAVMTAAVNPGAPLRCYRVDVSTVGSTWAATTYGGANTRPCLSYAADGVSVTRFVDRRWRFVTAGSAFNCPIPGHLPAAVQRDLRRFCHRG